MKLLYWLLGLASGIAVATGWYGIGTVLGLSAILLAIDTSTTWVVETVVLNADAVLRHSGER